MIAVSFISSDLIPLLKEKVISQHKKKKTELPKQQNNINNTTCAYILVKKMVHVLRFLYTTESSSITVKALKH